MLPSVLRSRAALTAVVLLALLAPPASAGPLDDPPRLTASSLAVTTTPGGGGTFHLHVANDGLWVGNVSLRASDPSGRMMLFLSTSDVLLGPGDGVDFTLNATTRPDIEPGNHTLVVTATREGAAPASLNLTLFVKARDISPVAPGFRLLVQQPHIAVQKGTNAVFDLRVENGRGLDLDVTLTATAAEGLRTWLEPATLRVPTERAGRATLLVNTTLAEGGEYVLRVTATARDAELQAEAVANLTVLDVAIQPVPTVPYRAEIRPGNLSLTLTAGERDDVSIVVRHAGHAAESVIRFGVVNVDLGPDVTFDPASPYRLARDGEVPVTLHVATLNTTVPGDYRYLLKAYPQEAPDLVAYRNLTVTVLRAPPAGEDPIAPPPGNDTRDPEPPGNETSPPPLPDDEKPATNDSREDLPAGDPQGSPAGENPPPEGGEETGLVPDQRAAAAAEGDTLLTRWVAEPRPLLAVAAVVAATAALAMRLRRESARYLALAPLAGLYTRLARSKVLDHETRDRIHELVLATPGIRYGELKRVTGLNAGALVHHLRTLERHQLVTSRREGPNRHFYPVGRRAPEPAPAPVTPMQARILDLLPEGGLTQREIAERVGLTQQGANYHVKTLERAGRITLRMHQGQWRCYRAAPPSPEPAPPASAARPPTPRGRA